MAILSRDKMVVKDEEGRFIAVPVKTLEKGVSVWLLNIYAPAQKNQKNRFWEESLPRLMQLVKARSSTRDIIITGMDANLPWEPRKDREWAIKDTEKLIQAMKEQEQASTWIQEWAEDNEMVDTWRQKHPTQEEYTWGHRQKEDYDTKQTLQEVDKQMKMRWRRRRKGVEEPNQQKEE